jgi:hypothetical protein
MDKIDLRCPSLTYCDPHGLRSVWEMLTFNGGEMVRAILALRSLEAISRNLPSKDSQGNLKKSDVINRASAKTILRHLREFKEAIAGLNVRTTNLAVVELRKHFAGSKIKITYVFFADLLEDVRVTFRRELTLIKMFCVEPKYESYFEIDLSAFGPVFKTAFTGAVYEIDEAGKCHALSRSTACIFHLMRAMEIGIRAVARSLGIPDPIKDAERNWGKILEKIKAEMDRRNAAKPLQWNANDRNFFAEVYASLDAVRVAWRNPTMHVENKYTEDESEHIFVTVRGFMKKLSSRMDEKGEPKA